MRITFLDNTKILACLLVIFAHLYSTYSPQRLYIYAFHMPLFFTISGVLHKYNGKIQLRKYLKKTFWPIIIYFIFFSILYIPLEYMISPDSVEKIETKVSDSLRIRWIWSKLTELINFTEVEGGKLLCYIYLYIIQNIRNLIFGQDCSNVVLWFLYALLWCKIILDIKNLFFNSKLLSVVFWSMILLGLIKQPSYFYFGQGIMAFPFYYIGYKYKALTPKIESKKYSLYIIPIALLSVAITIFNGRVSMSGLNYGTHHLLISMPVFYLNALIGSAALLLLGASLPSINFDNSTNSLITVLGAQMIFVIIFKHIFGDNPNIIVAIISTFIIFYICHLLHKYVFSRILP